MAERPDKKTLRDLLRVSFRHRRLFLLSASLFAVAALVAARYLPVKYKGITIFERRSDVAGAQTLKGPESFETIKLTLQHELVGRDAVERVAEELGLTRGLPRDSEGSLTLAGRLSRQAIVKKLRDNIRVKWDVRSENVDLISVSVTHSHPEHAQQIPDSVVKNYINRTSERIIQRLSTSRDFLLGQERDCKGRLTEVMNKKIEFETKHAGMMPENPSALQERIQQVSSDIDTLRRQHTAAKQTLARLNAIRPTTTGPATQPTQVVKGPNPELKQMRDELRGFEDQLDSAITLRHMTRKHPTVQTLMKKIAQLKERIKDIPEEVVLHKVFGTGAGAGADSFDAQVATVKSVLETTTRESERLEARREALVALMVNFAPVRQEYLQMVAKVNEHETELKRWQGQLREVQMALAAEVAKRRTHLNTVQRAQEQLRPSSPSLVIMLGFALVGGLAFGGGLVFLSNTMDRSVGTTEDAAKYFNVPVHGVISEIVTRREQRSRWFKRWILGGVVTVTILIFLSAALLNIVLWLRYPHLYKEWAAAPVAFVGSVVNGLFESMPGMF